MCSTNSVVKDRRGLMQLGRADLAGLVDYTLDLQAENGRLRDAAAQNSSNSSRAPSTDRPEKPQPKSLRKKSGRASGGDSSTVLMRGQGDWHWRPTACSPYRGRVR